MNNHPLTDELLQHIEEDLTRHDAWGRHILPSDFELMRAAADWQLEEVMKWLEENLGIVAVDGYFKPFWELKPDLKEAMRPTTQENN